MLPPAALLAEAAVASTAFSAAAASAEAGPDVVPRAAALDGAPMSVEHAGADTLGPVLAEPGGLRPFHIWSESQPELAEAIQDQFWKGEIFIATKDQVENPQWWADHNIGLAISGNDGAFRHAVQGRNWFVYPPGAVSINVPIMNKDEHLVADLLHRTVVMMISTLAGGRNAVAHDIESVHLAPLILMAFVAMFEKRDPAVLEDEDEVARSSAEIMGRLRSWWPAVGAEQVTCGTDDFLWQFRRKVYRQAVLTDLPDIVAGTEPAVTIVGEHRFVPVWWHVLDVVLPHTSQEDRDAAMREVLSICTGGLVSGLPPDVLARFARRPAGPETGIQAKAQPGAKASSQSKHPSTASQSKGGGKGTASQSKGAGKSTATAAAKAPAAKAPAGDRKGSGRGTAKGRGKGAKGSRSTSGGKGARGGGKPASSSGKPAESGEAPVRSRSPAARGSVAAALPPWHQGRGRGPALPAVPSARSPSRRPRLRSPAQAPRLRSPVPGTGRSPAPAAAPRSSTPGSGPIMLSREQRLAQRRLQFFIKYCELTEVLLLDRSWASLSHQTGMQPLHFLAQAVNRGHLQVPAGTGLSGLELLGGAKSMLHAMREHGADLDSPVGADHLAAGFTALRLLAKPHHRWSQQELGDVLALAEAILQQGGRVDAQVPRTGRTPLALAAAAGQEDMIRLLIRFEADPGAPDGDGVTPIELCRKGRQHATAALLVELATDRAVRSGGDLPPARPRRTSRSERPPAARSRSEGRRRRRSPGTENTEHPARRAGDERPRAHSRRDGRRRRRDRSSTGDYVEPIRRHRRRIERAVHPSLERSDVDR